MAHFSKKLIFLIACFVVFSNFNSILAEENKLDTDTTVAAGTTIENSDSLRYIPLENFLYGDTPRYIIMGGTPLVETKIKPLNLAIFTGALAGLFVLQHELQMNTIWKEHAEFTIAEDARYDIYIDKAGHFYGAHTASYFFREALVSSGFGWEASNNLGAGLGLAYSTYIEILDGYGKNWGFSPSDWYADVLGSVFFAAQNYFPVLQNFTPKFMYFPAEWTGNKSRIPHEIFMDDYASQVFFMSINVHNLLPKKWKKYYPDWLELSIGYAVRNILDQNSPAGRGVEPCSECISLEPGNWGSPRLIISLDYNMVKLLPDGSNTWNWFKQSLNLLKFPAPALEIGKVTRFYLIFPFKLI